MASFEDMVVVGVSKRRKQLTACENCHRKYSNFLLDKDHENQCGKYANIHFFTNCKLLVGNLRAPSIHIITDSLATYLINLLS